jgi:hypothetical protein
MSAKEPQASSPKQRRRWYQYSLWTLLVPERVERIQFSCGRLLVSFVFFGLATASPALVSWRFGYSTAAWGLLSAGLICTLVGAGIGVLIAGGRGAVGAALTAASLFVVAVGILFVTAFVWMLH